MSTTAAEENKNKLIAGIISLALFALLILFLFLYIIVTPNPPFAIGGGQGMEMALGMVGVGNDDVEYGSIGKMTDVVTEKSSQQSSDDIITDPNGDVETDIPEKPKTDNNTTVITPTKPVVEEKPKPKTAAELLAEKFNKNKNKSGGGIGDNETAGQEGTPDGNPNSHGKGGIGNDENGTGVGTGKGPDSGPNTGKGGSYGVSLAGRKIMAPPVLSKDTKEEGKVVVEITVDKNGTVIKAEPNGRGTTTNSPTLKQKAKLAAMATKFNPSEEYEEQRGTITIIFSF